MNAVGWLLAAVWAGVLAWEGGHGPMGRPLAMAGMLAVAIGCACAVPRTLRPPSLSWWWPLAAVAVLPPLMQALPLGFGHPWTAPDHLALGTVPIAWALDADAAARSAAWAVLWATTAWCAVLAFRGARAWRLAAAVTAAAAVHALVALPLSVLLPDWPTPGGRVRGTFAYVNQAAALWAACLPLALALVRADRARRRWWVAAAVVLATALVLSASRGGIIVGCLMAAPFAWLALPHRRRWLWAGAAATVLAAWLWTLNLAPVERRFAQLAGDHGLTLSGRLTLWQATLPQALAAGPWGVGPGADMLLYLRSGSEQFPRLNVTRLHNDHLSWLGAYGWVGLVSLLAAAGWSLTWMLRRLRTPAEGRDPRSQRIAIAALAGLTVLAMHAGAEFLWSNPALSLLGVLLLAVAAGAADDDPARRIRSGWRWRLGAAAAALALTAALVADWPRAAADRLAYDARDAAAARQRQELPLTGAASVQHVLATTPVTATAAVLKAEIAVVVGDQAAAEDALAVAAHRTAGHPMAWAMRARLANRAGDASAVATALDRLAVWAPTWITTRRAELAVLLGPLARHLPPERRNAALASALTGQSALPPVAILLAEHHLGQATVASLLARAEGGLVPQATEWMGLHGELEDWLALRQRLARGARAPAGWLVGQAYGGRPTRLPSSAAARLAAARTLGRERLPFPPALVALLDTDGPPGALEPARWPPPGAAVEPAWLASLAAGAEAYRAQLHHPPARQAYDEALLAAAVLAGRTDGVGRSAWPPLVDLASAHAATAPERARLEALRAVLINRGWEPLPDGQGQARWWDSAAEPQLTLRLPSWSGVAVDGRWLGWRRGEAVLEADSGGLRRVQVLVP